jgi:hypothetical protein
MGLRPTQGDEKCLGPATTLYGTVALSFVIPSVPGFPTSQLSAAPLMWFSLKENHMQLTEAATLDRKSGEAEGSAVPRTTTGKAEYDAQTELSSRPERSGVERSAVSFRFSNTIFNPINSQSFMARLKSCPDTGQDLFRSP